MATPQRPARAARPASTTAAPGTPPATDRPPSPPLQPQTSLADVPQRPKETLDVAGPGTDDPNPPAIDRALQESIFLALCANPALNGEDGLTNDTTVRQRFQHLRGLSEVAAFEFRKGNGQEEIPA